MKRRKSYSKEISHVTIIYFSVTRCGLQLYLKRIRHNAFAMFVHVYSAIYNKAFPKTRVKIEYYHSKSWLTEVLKNSIHQKNKLSKLSKQYPVADSIVKHKTYRSTLNKLLKRGENLYYQELFGGYRDNVQKTWCVINVLWTKAEDVFPEVCWNMLMKQSQTITRLLIHLKIIFNVDFDLPNRIPPPIYPYKHMKTEIMNSIFLETVHQRNYCKFKCYCLAYVLRFTPEINNESNFTLNLDFPEW